jgi:hypothetical protein
MRDDPGVPRKRWCSLNQPVILNVKQRISCKIRSHAAPNIQAALPRQTGMSAESVPRAHGYEIPLSRCIHAAVCPCRTTCSLLSCKLCGDYCNTRSPFEAAVSKRLQSPPPSFCGSVRKGLLCCTGMQLPMIVLLLLFSQLAFFDLPSENLVDFFVVYDVARADTPSLYFDDLSCADIRAPLGPTAGRNCSLVPGPHVRIVADLSSIATSQNFESVLVTDCGFNGTTPAPTDYPSLGSCEKDALEMFKPGNRVSGVMLPEATEVSAWEFQRVADPNLEFFLPRLRLGFMIFIVAVVATIGLAVASYSTCVDWTAYVRTRLRGRITGPTEPHRPWVLEAPPVRHRDPPEAPPPGAAAPAMGAGMEIHTVTTVRHPEVPDA